MRAPGVDWDISPRVWLRVQANITGMWTQCGSTTTNVVVLQLTIDVLYGIYFFLSNLTTTELSLRDSLLCWYILTVMLNITSYLFGPHDASDSFCFLARVRDQWATFNTLPKLVSWLPLLTTWPQLLWGTSLDLCPAGPSCCFLLLVQVPPNCLILFRLHKLSGNSTTVSNKLY